MSILDSVKGLFRSRDKPKDFFFWSSPFSFGMTSSGMQVDPNTAITTSAVYACVRLLAESIAGLPLHVYKYEGQGKVKVPGHPLYTLLHDVPNSEMTSFTWRETSMAHILLWGNLYSQIIRDRAGRVVGLYPLQPSRMTVNRDKNLKVYYTYTLFQDDNPNMKNKKSVDLPAEQVLHIPGLGYDGLVGYSPIAMAKTAIGMCLATENFGSSFFQNGARLGGVLEHPGTLKDPEKVRAAWQAAYGGSGNTGKVAVLEEGLKYQQIAIPPEDAQYLQTRKFQINEIARIFRVPPHMIGDLEKATFSNIEEQSLEFVKYTLNPWVVRWEQGLSKALLTEEERRQGYFIKFNIDGLMRGDYKSRMDGYAVGRQNGWLSTNDIREMENMNPIPAEDGGDLYLVNGNMARLPDAGNAYTNNGSNEGGENE